MFLNLLKDFFFLFAVIDPLGSIPVFLKSTQRFDPAVRRRIAFQAPAIAGLILIFFIVLGQIILELMHVTLPAFQVAGGVILFLFALTMIFGLEKADEQPEVQSSTHVAIFPLAMPSIASPGAILAVVLLTDNEVYLVSQQLATAGLVCLVMVATTGLLFAAGQIQKKLGEAFISIFTKIMGLIIAAFAMESILGGIKSYFAIR